MFSLTQKGEHRKIAEKFRKQQVFSNDMKVNPPEFIKFSFNLNLTDIGRSISSHTPVEILYFSISSKKAKLGWEMLAGRVSFNHTVNENEYDKLSKECLPRINGELKELTWLDVIFLLLMKKLYSPRSEIWDAVDEKLKQLKTYPGMEGGINYVKNTQLAAMVR